MTLSPVPGTHLVCCEILEILGVDPFRCKGFSLHFPADGIVTARFEMMPDAEQIQAIKEKQRPVAGGITKFKTETELLGQREWLTRVAKSELSYFSDDPAEREAARLQMVKNLELDDPQPITVEGTA